MKFQCKTLNSGLRIISIPLRDTPTVSVLAIVEAGSKYEDKTTSGLSHFLEHMCFKGTQKRPSALDISYELDAVGAQSNAFTSYEFTGYYAKAHKKHLPILLDVISDIYLNPVFNKNELEKEQGVIIEEINMYNDMPQRRVGEVFMELLYKDQPAGCSILGPKENIRKFTRQDFVSYRAKHYVAEGTTVIIAGSFNEDEIIESITKIFEPISKEKKHSKENVKEIQKNSALAVETRKTDQMHIVCGARTFSVNHQSVPTLQVLDAVLGGGMSGRLFQNIREKLGAAYYVRSGTDFFTDHGFLAVSTGVDPLRVEEVGREIISEFTRLKEELVPARELQKAKDYVIGTMYLDLETSDATAEFYGLQAILRQPLKTPEEIALKMREVTAYDIKALAEEFFINERLNTAIVGNISSSENLAKAFSFSS
ncbi:MAG: insulinase family protein [Candidatus Pacebacteria bacterium]|nr:insulinase family protein [Candidatus Paceibacterota bacterium]